jgi:hypothetical protein
MQRPANFLIREGREYAGLFPPATGKNTTIDRDADLALTLEVLPDVVRKYYRQAAEVAARLQGKTRRECAKNIWEFCYWHFQYATDEPGTEQIRTPARSWHDRYQGIDCDCFTVLASCLLLNMTDPATGRQGIEHTYRVTKYTDLRDPDPPFKHIYLVVPDSGREWIIDPVMNLFDYEVPFIEKIELPMKLQVLNGIPGNGPAMSIDQMDLQRAGSGLEAAPRGPKMQRLHQQAAEQGITIEEVQEQNRQTFIKTYGKTPEQYRQEHQNTLSQSQAAAKAREEETLAKLRAELTKRKVKFPANATRDQLLALIRQSPKVSGISNVVSTINKVNPATVLLRQGLLLGLKKNLFNVAGKLQWAIMARQQAIGAGVADADYTKLQSVFEKLKSIFHNAGGDFPNLISAIRQGGGGRQESMDGLGEPAAAAAIAAATAALTTLAAILKKIKTPAAPADPNAPLSPDLYVSNTQGKTPGDPATNTSFPTPQGENMGFDPNETDDPKPEKKGLIGWVKDNPLPAAGIGIVIVGGGVLAVRHYRKKAPTTKTKSLNGVKRPTVRDKKGRFKKFSIK